VRSSDRSQHVVSVHLGFALGPCLSVPFRDELLGRVRFLSLRTVDVRHDRGEHPEQLVDPAVADRSLDLLESLPLCQLARRDPREQLFDRAPERER
jgi:hypothetical protein